MVGLVGYVFCLLSAVAARCFVGSVIVCWWAVGLWFMVYFFWHVWVSYYAVLMWFSFIFVHATECF